MRRLFPPHAYSDDRIEQCYWAEAVPDQTLCRPPLSGSHETDIAVIGAGFTGLSAALELAQNGKRVTVLDARFPGWGASGRNGGFCCLGGSMLADAQMDRAFGKSERLLWRQAEKAAVEHVASLVAKLGIDVDAHSDGETILAHKPSKAGFDGAAAEIRENYGVMPQVFGAQDLPAQGMNGPFYGAMTNPIGFGLHPRKYLLGLLEAAEAEGAIVFGDTQVTRISKAAGRFQLECDSGRVTCDKLVLATNGYSSEDLPEWMAARYIPAQSSIMVTRPLNEAELGAAAWTSRQISYNTRNLLHYFRLLPNNRFLFGMRGGLRSTPKAERKNKRIMRRDFERMFPAWRHVETPFYWSGMVCFAPHMAPFCGPVREVPGLYAGFGFHGNGVAMGSYCGAQLAHMILDHQLEQPLPNFVQEPPKRFPFGRFRLAMLRPAYALAALRDL